MTFNVIDGRPNQTQPILWQQTQADTLSPQVRTATSAQLQNAIGKRSVAVVALQQLSVFGQFLQAVKQISSNISALSNSAKQQRVVDRKQGLGVSQGAKNFSSEAQDFYNFLSKIDLGQFKGAKITDGVGALAQQYTQLKAGQMAFSAAQTLFPETTQEISSAFGVGTAAAEGATAETAASAGALGAETTSTLSTIGSVGGQVLGAVGAGYSLYQIFKGKLDPEHGAISGAAAGAYIGTMICPGMGTAIGGVVGAVGGALSGMFKSGKPKDQKQRDAIRKQLQQAGILDKDWNIQLANGSKFDMGADGGAKLTNKDGTERKYEELDPSDPLAPQVMQLAAPLAQMMTGGDPKLTQDFANYLTNAATSNASTPDEAVNNLAAIYKNCGVPFDQVIAALQQRQNMATE